MGDLAGARNDFGAVLQRQAKNIRVCIVVFEKYQYSTSLCGHTDLVVTISCFQATQGMERIRKKKAR